MFSTSISLKNFLEIVGFELSRDLAGCPSEQSTTTERLQFAGIGIIYDKKMFNIFIVCTPAAWPRPDPLLRFSVSEMEQICCHSPSEGSTTNCTSICGTRAHGDVTLSTSAGRVNVPDIHALVGRVHREFLAQLLFVGLRSWPWAPSGQSGEVLTSGPRGRSAAHVATTSVGAALFSGGHCPSRRLLCHFHQDIATARVWDRCRSSWRSTTWRSTTNWHAQ